MLAVVLILAGQGIAFGWSDGDAGPVIRAGNSSEVVVAGNLEAQLQGRWQVTSVHQAEDVATVQPTLDFRPGVVAAFGGCNEFALLPEFYPNGTLSLMLRPDPPLNKVCDAEASTVERLVLQALSKVNTVEFDDAGTLRMSAFGQVFLTATRAP